VQRIEMPRVRDRMRYGECATLHKYASLMYSVTQREPQKGEPVVLRAKEVQADMAKQAVPQFEMRHRMELALEYGNISVSEIAAELGMSRTTISNWLHGRTEPRRRDLIVWALTCGVPLEWIIDGTVPDAAPAEAEKPKKRTRRPA
jgi:DNA-binding transcriptional regulator YiaG